VTTYDPQLLEKYAELAIRVGVNLQESQRLLIAGVPVKLAPLARLLTKHAYLAGAKFVDVEWEDAEIDRLRLEYGSPESLHQYPDWRVQLNVDYFEKQDATLAILGEDPDIMAGQDPQAMAIVNQVRAEKTAVVLDHISGNSSNWSMIGGSTAAWAQRVFPDLPCEAAEERLWEVIFEVCRVRSADPIAAWQQHIKDLARREAYLNARRYRRLRFRGPGTDLLLGLPAGHRWLSGGLTAKNGVHAVVNIPTEEVFTLPHKGEVEGFVTSTKPLSFAGSVIENFSLTFENGSVVQATAEKGQHALDTLLETDEGARSLGEVALVPHSSPVSQSKLLFYNTLFDENASSHLALGAAYKFSIEGGTEMTEEAFSRIGGNQSRTHVDFMVGSGEMAVDGILPNAAVEPVMREGEWAFDV
jgi:aminopeptidase